MLALPFIGNTNTGYHFEPGCIKVDYTFLPGQPVICIECPAHLIGLEFQLFGQCNEQQGEQSAQRNFPATACKLIKTIAELEEACEGSLCQQQRQRITEPARVPDHIPESSEAVDALHVRTLYQADARAFALEDRWVNLAAIPGFRAAPLSEISANEWLVQNAPFSHGTLDYSAAAASSGDAVHLTCPPGTPLMVLERRTFSPDAPITFMRLSYAPGHHLHLNI